MINVRKSTPKDINGIRRVQKITWIDTYPNEQAGITQADIEGVFKNDESPKRKKKIEEIKKRYEDNSKQTWVAGDGGCIVGFCEAIKEEETGRVSAIYVLPEHQNRGIGSQLFDKALKWLGENRPIYINVVSYNQKAISFYKKHGFMETGKEGVLDGAAVLPCGKSLPEVELVKSYR